MVTLYMLDAVDIKIDIIDINRYLKYIIDINDINIGIYFGHEWNPKYETLYETFPGYATPPVQ